MRHFNGLVSWYHRHLKNVARSQRSLNKFSPKVPWKWSEVKQQSFDDVKKALVETPRLYVSIPGQPFILYTDTSDFGLSAILVQKGPEKGIENSIEVLSRLLRNAELYQLLKKSVLLSFGPSKNCDAIWKICRLRSLSITKIKKYHISPC